MGEVRVKSSGLKKRIEQLIGPLNSWQQYFTAMGAVSVTHTLPDGAALFWAAVAMLDDGETIRDPSSDRLFKGIVETLDDDALLASMAGATALIKRHEEAGAVETARTLRAAHDVAAKEFEGRNRKWDA